MSPDSFSTRTVNKTMINCLPPAAYRTLTRTYISRRVINQKRSLTQLSHRVPHLAPVIVKRGTWAEEGDPCTV